MAKNKLELKTRNPIGFGWHPDLPDQRDLLYKPPYGALKAIPASADLTKSKGYFAPYDQGQLGSCTANAIAGALQFDALVQKAPMATNPSRLFIYFNERVIEGTVGTDAGAQLRDGIWSVAHYGAPSEDEWVYDISKFTKKPPASCYTDATKDKAINYRRLVPDAKLAQLTACLGVEKKPFVFGFTVYESFESDEVASTGIVPMPSAGEQVIGGHAVLAVGYDQKKRRLKVRNSWGPDWGLAGHFWLPFDYVVQAQLASDFWTITSTSVTPVAA